MNMGIYKFNLLDLYFTWPTHSGLRVKDRIRSTSIINGGDHIDE